MPFEFINIEKENIEKERRIVFPTSEGALTPEEITDVLLNGKVKILGRVEEFVSDIQQISHQNVVNFVLVVVEEKGKRLQAIFKPLSGEGINEMKEIIHEEGLVIIQRKPLYKEYTSWKDVAYYPREVFAYLISTILGLHIVPPTVVREIEIKRKLEIGALQVFIPRTEFQMASTLLLDNQISISDILRSPYALKIALLDFLLGCGKRTWDDVLVRVKKEEGAIELLAIDHGNSMCEEVIEELTVILPSENLVIYISKEGEKIVFPLLGGIRRALVKRSDLNILVPEIYIERAQWILNNSEKLKEKLIEMGIYGETEDGLKLITEKDFNGFLKRLRLFVEFRKVL